MLSNKIITCILLLAVSCFFISCTSKKEPPPQHLFENEQLVLKTAKDIAGENISFTTSGYFNSDTLKSIVAGEEINEKNSWGIKFYLITWKEGEFQKTYSTGLLEGSFVQSVVDKIKISDFKNELIYYNSKSYFLGNAGGDVYSHIIDFKGFKTYSAHLSVAPGGRVSLELSENIDKKIIRDFFIGYFRRDYPNLSVVERIL